MTKYTKIKIYRVYINKLVRSPCHFCVFMCTFVCLGGVECVVYIAVR
jgi:hypothetical protein